MGVLTWKGATAKEALGRRSSPPGPTSGPSEQGFADNEAAVPGASSSRSRAASTATRTSARATRTSALPTCPTRRDRPGCRLLKSNVSNPAQYGNNVMIPYAYLGDENLTKLATFLDASRAASSGPPVAASPIRGRDEGLSRHHRAPRARRMRERILGRSSRAGAEVGLSASSAGIEVLATELYREPRSPATRSSSGSIGDAGDARDGLRGGRLEEPVRERLGEGRRIRRMPMLDGDGRHDRLGRDVEPHPPCRVGRAEGGAEARARCRARRRSRRSTSRDAARSARRRDDPLPRARLLPRCRVRSRTWSTSSSRGASTSSGSTTRSIERWGGKGREDVQSPARSRPRTSAACSIGSRRSTT